MGRLENNLASHNYFYLAELLINAIVNLSLFIDSNIFYRYIQDCYGSITFGCGESRLKNKTKNSSTKLLLESRLR